MASFADFARSIVSQQVAYYEQSQGEYNQDPFSLRYRDLITIKRIFDTPLDGDQDFEGSMGASQKLEDLAFQYEKSLESEERRQRKLFQDRRVALTLKECELSEILVTEDPVLTALSKDPFTKKALVEYRRYGLERLRYVSSADVLAVVDPLKNTWFYPRTLPECAVRLDPSLYSVGDALGFIEQRMDHQRRTHVPKDMNISRDNYPFWFTQLQDFYPQEFLRCTPLEGLDHLDKARPLSDPTQELVYAMVVTRQVATFFGQGKGSYPSSYNIADRLHEVFRRHVQVQLVDPALEALHRKFEVTDWSNLCLVALQHLPVFLPDGWNEEDGGECLITGETNNLVRFAVVRCPITEWNHEGRFEDHLAIFKARYTRGQQQWWHLLTQRPQDGNLSKRRRRISSCSSTSWNSSAVSFSNSRIRGRKTLTASGNDGSRRDPDDDYSFDGFLVGPWRNGLVLNEEVARLVLHAWRLTHMDWWIDGALLQWRKKKSSFCSTNEDAIHSVTELIMTALHKCQALTES